MTDKTKLELTKLLYGAKASAICCVCGRTGQCFHTSKNGYVCYYCTIDVEEK